MTDKELLLLLLDRFSEPFAAWWGKTAQIGFEIKNPKTVFDLAAKWPDDFSVIIYLGLEEIEIHIWMDGQSSEDYELVSKTGWTSFRFSSLREVVKDLANQMLGRIGQKNVDLEESDR